MNNELYFIGTLLDIATPRFKFGKKVSSPLYACSAVRRGCHCSALLMKA